MRYAFGDTDTAARRLEMLARVFASSSRAFLLEAAADKPRLAVDLGCGPGYTTHFLAEVLACERAAGLDNSERYIALARQRESAAISFHLHDVTEAPFPVRPADLLYSRFLLAHLRDPAAVVKLWSTLLRPRGRLLMEETEWIRTGNPVFRAYLEIVEVMLTQQGNRLYVGADLPGLAESAGLRRRLSRVWTLAVAERDAATLFCLNIRTWKRHPFIQAQYPTTAIARLEADLEALAGRTSHSAEIEFGLRQVMGERG